MPFQRTVGPFSVCRRRGCSPASVAYCFVLVGITYWLKVAAKLSLSLSGVIENLRQIGLDRLARHIV